MNIKPEFNFCIFTHNTQALSDEIDRLAACSQNEVITVEQANREIREIRIAVEREFEKSLEENPLLDEMLKGIHGLVSYSKTVVLGPPRKPMDKKTPGEKILKDTPSYANQTLIDKNELSRLKAKSDLVDSLYRQGLESWEGYTHAIEGMKENG